MVQNRNVFLFKSFKENEEPSIVKTATNLLYLHSTSGKKYTVNIVTLSNYQTITDNLPCDKITFPLPDSPSANFLNNYIINITKNINLTSTQLELFIKVNLICNYGGICVNEHFLLLNNLESLFNIIEGENTDGFFIINKMTNENTVKTSIFGSKKNTDIMLQWNNMVSNMNINYVNNLPIPIICSSNNYFNRYKLIEDYISPLNYICDNLIREKFTQNKIIELKNINNENDNIKEIMCEKNMWETLIPLDNTTVKINIEQKFFQQNRLINYFINKSIENMNLIDYDFIEIGTSNFNTLIETADDNTLGLSIDAVKHYIDVLPNKPNIKKLNIGISNVNSTIDVYYIPENIISQYNIPDFFKGCNCLNDYHPLHKVYNITHYCQIDKVNVITTYELFYQNKVRNVKFLKIDTEGHDCIILDSLFLYIKYLPDIFYPNKIQFETNENINTNMVDNTINSYLSIGYTLESRGYDTVLVYQR